MDSSDRSPPPSDAHLARIIVRTLAAAIALTLAGGIASAAGRLGDETDETAADTIVGAGGGAPLSPRGGLGPLPGTSVPAYVRARAEALSSSSSGVAGRRSAVVSFSRYVTPEAAAAAEGVQLVALLIALPGGRPVEAAPDDDLDVLATRLRDEAAAEKKALEQLLPTVDDSDFQAQYEADIDRLGRMLAAFESSGDASALAIVYAVIVVGDASRLRALSELPGVRLVDIGPNDERPPPGEAAGLRPEETHKAGTPPTRPA